MAGRFTSAQWDQIEAELAANRARYGMPDGPREESMLFASFNIRKLGSIRSRQRELAFMARFCARCDLVAIQEIQDSLEGLTRLKELVDERVSSAGEFELLVSDITGEVPGESGMAERLAFLYRKSRVRRMDVTSDLAIDRTGVIENFSRHESEIIEAWEAYQTKVQDFQGGRRRTKPTFSLPAFLTFTRTPYVRCFRSASGEKRKATTVHRRKCSLALWSTQGAQGGIQGAPPVDDDAPQKREKNDCSKLHSPGRSKPGFQ